MNLQILPSYQIDTAKWDACVAKSSNGLVYASFAYLNSMADNWSGLIINDYESIMPLPWRRKWGITYLYTPPFMQQLGLIGNTFLVDENILKAINKFTKYGDYFFNFPNKLFPFNGTLSSKCNYILVLSVGYDSIKKGYSNELNGYLKKVNIAGLQYKDANVKDAIDLYQKHYQLRMPHLQNEDFEHYKKLCSILEKEEKAFAKEVLDKSGNQLAIALFLKDNKRIYNLMPTTLPDGRKQFAMHFLLDSLFQDYAQQELLFDFEGSDLTGVKKFYEQFGSINQPYLHWHFNNLPWLLKLIKH